MEPKALNSFSFLPTSISNARVSWPEKTLWNELPKGRLTWFSTEATFGDLEEVYVLRKVVDRKLEPDFGGQRIGKKQRKDTFVFFL